MRLHAAGLCVELDGTRIVDDVELAADNGEVVALVGPNGSGKSTILKALYRVLKPVAGSVNLGGDDLWRLSAKETARRSAVVAQETSSEFDFSALEVVYTGRAPHKSFLHRDNAYDRDIVERALDCVGMAALTNRIFATLSGGEKQKVLLACAPAQEPHVLILDEPTNHLDVCAQLDVLTLMIEQRLTTIVALHDLNHALAYADPVLVVAAGRVVAAGPCQDVLTPELVEAVFRVHAQVVQHAATGRPHLLLSRLPTQLSGAPPRFGSCSYTSI